MTAPDPRAWCDQVDARAKEDAPPTYKVADDVLVATTALRAVLDLHRTMSAAFCQSCFAPYPCPTVTAITTALEDA